MSTEWIIRMLPWLAILACPVTMMWMTRGGMSGTDGHGTDPTEHNREDSPTMATSVPGAAEIEQLRARVAELEARQREPETRPVQRSA